MDLFQLTTKEGNALYSTLNLYLGSHFTMQSICREHFVLNVSGILVKYNMQEKSLKLFSAIHLRVEQRILFLISQICAYQQRKS